MAAETSESPSARSKDTTKATVAYILMWLTGLIVFLMADKADKFTRFHAIQAIGLGIVYFAVYIVLNMFWMIALTGAGMAAIWSLLQLALFVLGILAVVFLAMKAYKGQMYGSSG
jgi:uncharacterized membrane protein